MLTRLATHFKGRVQTYYFDISFEETLRRHATKPNSQDFGETEMNEWWQEKDFLGLADERIITNETAQDEILAMILKDCGY